MLALMLPRMVRRVWRSSPAAMPEREYTPDERARVLTEAAMPGSRMLQAAQRYGIPPSLMYRWCWEAG